MCPIRVGFGGRVNYQGPRWLKPLLQRCKVQCYDRITELRLTGGNYGDNVIPLVTTFRHLKKLSLTETRITPDGVKTLRERLRRCAIEV